MSKLQRLSLAVRKRLPYRVRRILRLGYHLVSSGQASAAIPANLLADCRVCATRHHLVGLLPRGGRIAEVGTQRGEFAQIIVALSEPTELHLVDLDFSSLPPALPQDARVVLHAGHSHAVLQGFPDNYFDWIYIDADHSFDAVTRDANAAASKVRPGGYLVFNDFAHIDPDLGVYGVQRAVVDFAIARQWQFAWFAYQQSALYDVALQRPLEVR